EIRKDFLVPLQHPVNEVEIPAAHHQLEAKLVEAHRVAKLFRDPPRVIAIRHIHGEYQAFARSRSLVGHLMGLLRGSVTRQSRKGAGASILTAGTRAGRNSLSGLPKAGWSACRARQSRSGRSFLQRSRPRHALLRLRRRRTPAPFAQTRAPSAPARACS